MIQIKIILGFNNKTPSFSISVGFFVKNIEQPFFAGGKRHAKFHFPIRLTVSRIFLVKHRIPEMFDQKYPQNIHRISERELPIII